VKTAGIMLLILMSLSASAQKFNLDSIQVPEDFEHVFVKQISGDSLSTSFLIVVKTEVKLHKHISHTENVYVIEGRGKMRLGDHWLDIKAGDLIFIPKNTPHKVIVTSEIPLKVISIQSPVFDGSDRILLE
jgi:mannose-6-phosphate isomerase-like protein (cupin superfamily)